MLNGRQVAFFSLGTRHHDLALVEAPGAMAQGGPPRLGLNHIGLKVGNGLDDLRCMRDALIARGVMPSRYVEYRVCQSMNVDDPDGNTIELYVDADPAIWARDPQSIVLRTPWCSTDGGRNAMNRPLLAAQRRAGLQAFAAWALSALVAPRGTGVPSTIRIW